MIKREPKGKPAAVKPDKKDVAVEGAAKKSADKTPAADQITYSLTEGMTVKEFAEVINKSGNDVIKKLLSYGEMMTINQPISKDSIEVLAEEFGFSFKIITEEEKLSHIMEEDYAELTEPKAPVVTVMGHVDHGKTSLLDAIRSTDVISKEAGGITQHIGAYQVVHNNKKITFLDTPGHEAFTAMRARGAKVTDIAVLVVAADDGVRPQTIEALDHAKAAGVPIIVAVNKIDKEGANPDRVRQEMTEHGIVAEEWGGENIFVNISAKQGLHINELLDMILLVADVQELKSTHAGYAKGSVIEAKLDKGRGPVATVLVQQGTLRLGAPVVMGTVFGKVRAMVDDKGNQIEMALPAQPVEIIGLSSVPSAGDELRVLEDEREARHIAEERALKKRLLEATRQKHVSLDDLFDHIQEGKIDVLNLVLKTDVQGSSEAIVDALSKLNQTRVRINVIHKAVGGITEADIMLASASNAIVIGFNVRPAPKSRAMADKEAVDVRLYQVIYKLVEDIESAIVGMLPPEIEEVEKGRAEIREPFKVPKIGWVAGSYIQSGEFTRDSKVRIIRDSVIIFTGELASLRRFKDDVKEVKAGLECGIGFKNFQDIKAGDIVEAYVLIERPGQLTAKPVAAKAP